MIISFSGTGNSFLVADRLQKHLHEKNFMKLQRELILTENPVIDLEQDDTSIIWVFPTFSWGIPPVVLNFINRCKFEGSCNIVHHLVVTCGDDTGNLSKLWKKLLAKLNWQCGGIWSVQMPNTYVLMKGFDVDPHDVEVRKLEECEARIEKIACAIKDGCQIIDIVKGKWASIKTTLIYPWFVKHTMSPKPFHATQKCTGCRLCSQECPMENIEMSRHKKENPKPMWKDNCAMCLRCYHQCPVNAVQYGVKTRGKGQYMIGKLIESNGFFKKLFTDN